MSGKRTGRSLGIALCGAVVAATLCAVPTAASAAVQVVGPKCTRTIIGFVGGTQSVPAGEVLCLRDAVIGGAITVAPGGALDSKSSTVNGAISLSGAVSFLMCDSAVIGAISALVGGQVSIGDNYVCLGSYVDGAVTLNGNVGGVRIAGATVTGAVTVNDNRTGALAGPRIGGNQIGGALACAGNSPPPTNTGRPNAVTGEKSGQCRTDRF